MRQSYLIRLVAAAVFALAATCASAAQRSSPASCRDAVNGLVSMLDGKMDDSPLYRETFGVVVNTCGPATNAAQPAPLQMQPDRAACHELAAAMTGLIEDDKMNSAGFAKARIAFAQRCGPR
jgi:hypothetical protein